MVKASWRDLRGKRHVADIRPKNILRQRAVKVALRDLLRDFGAWT
jgi:hypothetical protein